MGGRRGRVVCFGEAMVRTTIHPIQDSETGSDPLPITPGSLAVTPGGAEYNVACALSYLGNEAAWVSALSEDESSELVLEAARSAGVQLVVEPSSHPVGTYRVEGGAVSYDRSQSAFANLEPGAIDWRARLDGARWLVVSGITPLLGEGPLANWSAAMTFAELDGTLVALDLNHRPALGSFEELWQEIEPRLRQVHLLIISPENLLILTGADTEQALSELRSKWNLPYLACTWKRTVNGSLESTSPKLNPLTSKQIRWSAVAHSLGIASTKNRPTAHLPIEPLGGGDAWLAGFIDGLLGGNQPDVCCRRGDLLAALTQQTFGDLGEVTRAELSVWESIEGAVDLSERR